MVLSLEQGYYERAEFWGVDIYQRAFEHARLSACVAAIPTTATSLLDVGAGNGVFLGMVESGRSDIACVGLERSATAIESAVCNSPLVPGEITALPYAPREFDVVSALDVIEHIPFGVYEKALTELSRVAGQYILLNVPYKENRLSVVCTYCGCHFNPHFHMRAFTEHILFGLFPDFEVMTSALVCRETSVVEAALNPLRKRVFGGFPSHCVCPQCGYAPSGASNSSTTSGSAVRPVRNLIKKAVRAFPKIRVPAEIVVVYQRRNLR